MDINSEITQQWDGAEMVDAWKWAFGYNPMTREFTGPVQAQLSPLDMAEGRVQYVLPANATYDAPGDNPGAYKIHRRSLDLASWEIVDDYRQALVYEKATGHAAVLHIELGYALPDTLTTVAPAQHVPGSNMRDVWNEERGAWETVPDFSMYALYDTATADALPRLAVGDLMPEGATTLPPPIAERTKPVWNGTGWDSVMDKRGTTYYDADGQEQTITELGQDVPEDGSLLPPPPSPLEQAVTLRDSLRAEADREIAWRQDAVMLEIASEADKGLLIQWQIYRVNLARLDLSETVPSSWPTKPPAVAAAE